MSARLSRMTTLLAAVILAAVLGTGLALSEPSQPLMTRADWKPRAVGIDFKNAKRPDRLVKEIFAEEKREDKGVAALFPSDPEMRKKIRYLPPQDANKDGFLFLTVHSTTVPGTPKDVKLKMRALQDLAQQAYLCR